MSVMIQMKNPPGEAPPPPSRLYWICQAAGWGSFVLYTLGFYIVFAIPRWEVVLSIVVIDGLLCPALTHAFRSLMYRRGWTRLPARARLPRTVAAASVLAIVNALAASPPEFARMKLMSAIAFTLSPVNQRASARSR